MYVKKCVEDIVRNINGDGTICLNYGKEKFTVKLESVIYVKICRYQITFYFKDSRNNMVIKENMEKIQNQLTRCGFFMVQAGYMINMVHVKEKQDDFVVLEDGRIIPVRMGRK